MNDRAEPRKREEPSHTFTLEVSVENPIELFDVAYATAIANGNAPEDARRMLERDGEISIEACLIELLEPGDLAGCSILNSHATKCEGIQPRIVSYIDDVLPRRRKEAADRAFEAYDFGTIDIQDTGAWRWATPGTEMRRPIFITVDPELRAFERESGTERAEFVVRFVHAQSADVRECYGITAGGEILGVPVKKSEKAANHVPGGPVT